MLNIVEMSVLLKLNYRFNVILIKNLSRLFVEIDKLILKFICKVLRKAKTTLKNNNKVGELTLPDFKTYYKTTGFRTVWYWYKGRQNRSMKPNRVQK